METIFEKYSGGISALTALFDTNTLILTPNTRLATRLRQAMLSAKGVVGSVKDLPDAVSQAQWIEEQITLAQIQGLVSTKPLAKPIEEIALWRDVIEDSDYTVVNAKALAKQAQSATNNLSLWCVDTDHYAWQFDAEPDSKAFKEWHQTFSLREKKQPWQTQATLNKALVQADVVNADQRIILVGFYDLNPMFVQMVSKAARCVLFYWQQQPELAQYSSFNNSNEEIESAARWAKSLAEQDPTATICICVPDLNQRRDEVFKALEMNFQAGAILPGAARRNDLFNVSAGVALAQMPVARSLLNVLRAFRYSLKISEWLKLLYCPFLNLSKHTGFLDTIAGLHRFPLPEARLGELLAFLGNNTVFEPYLEIAKSLNGSESLSYWYDKTQQIIELSTWSENRTLNSLEYQQHDRCIEVLRQLNELKLPKRAFSYAGWFDLINDAFQQTVFHSQSPPCSVQVLGVLEASGQCFDHLWLCGLQENEWPSSLAPNPLIPSTLQQELEMPRGSHTRELAYATQVLNGFRYGAKQLVTSFVRVIDEVDVAMTPLLPEPEKLSLLSFRSDVESPVQASFLHVEDEDIPLYDDEKTVSASALVAQSQCPMKAFFGQRLALSSPIVPSYGLSPAERGALLHAAFEAFFKTQANFEQLQRLSDQELHAVIDASATIALNRLASTRKRTLAEASLSIERLRLQRLLEQWLALQQQQSYCYEIAELEKPVQLQHNGLTVNMRIDRIDSYQGKWLIIDYKSSKPSGLDWYEERMFDPQLPIYAVAISSSEKVCGVAVATVKQYDCSFGVEGQVDGFIKKSLPEEVWLAQLETWHSQVIDLCTEYTAGLQLATPSDKACGYCNYASLCRMHTEIEVQNAG